MAPACEADGAESFGAGQHGRQFAFRAALRAAEDRSADDAAALVVELVAAADELDLFVIKFNLLALNVAWSVDEILFDPADDDGAEGAVEL